MFCTSGHRTGKCLNSYDPAVLQWRIGRRSRPGSFLCVAFYCLTRRKGRLARKRKGRIEEILLPLHFTASLLGRVHYRCAACICRTYVTPKQPIKPPTVDASPCISSGGHFLAKHRYGEQAVNLFMQGNVKASRFPGST